MLRFNGCEVKAMLSNVKKATNWLLRFIGLDLHRTAASSFHGRLVTAFNRFGVDIVFDIGANIGQLAIALRQAGFNDRIISFEPLSEAYVKLCESAKRDSTGLPIHILR